MIDTIMPDTLPVNGKEYKIIRLLGKGKGGYSYLASDGERQYVLKQIHHEPCSYYQFGNKLQAEINDYDRLKKIGIRVPEMIDADIENERILKEYIDGSTIFELVKSDCMKNEYMEQVKAMCMLLYPANTNLTNKDIKIFSFPFLSVQPPYPSSSTGNNMVIGTEAKRNGIQSRG